MSCSYAEKVSMLIDGELPSAEIETVEWHLAQCSGCQNLEKDFLFFRRQIKTSAAGFVETKAIDLSPAIALKERTPVRKSWISPPVPALAAFVLAVIGLGAWLVFSRLSRNPVETATTQTPVKNTAPKKEKSPNEISLARYDAGGRAEIYVLPKQTK